MAVFGVRPEAIKMAPVVQAVAADPDLEMQVVVTGQHRHLLDQVLEHFHIVPDADLAIMQERQTLTHITSRVLTGLEPVLEGMAPDLVLVHGDTTTSFAAALAAFYRQIPVGHVEAGLRTRNRYSPFPEEMNRHLTGALATLHFAPTAEARGNLLEEGVRQGITVTGNTAVDALLATVRPDHAFSDGMVREALDLDGRILLVEAHRRENWGPRMDAIAQGLLHLSRRNDVRLLVSVHPNPAVAEPLHRHLAGQERIHLLAPQGYPDWANLMGRAHLILSDSGGIQEEAPALGVPVLVLRDETERPEALAAGTVALVGADPGRIAGTADRLLDDSRAYAAMAQAVSPYGDGQAARRILEAIRHHFGLGPPAEEYSPTGGGK